CPYVVHLDRNVVAQKKPAIKVSHRSQEQIRSPDRTSWSSGLRSVNLHGLRAPILTKAIYDAWIRCAIARPNLFPVRDLSPTDCRHWDPDPRQYSDRWWRTRCFGTVKGGC